MERTPQKDLQPLDYESATTPSQATHRRREAAGCFGIGALVLGVPLVVGGFLRFIGGVREVNRFLRSDGPWEAAFGLALGGILIAAGVRWTRAWRGRTRRLKT
jgi:hypothetical protein